jgi:hypothetical protein
MFATMRRHHHPVDAWEPDDADEIAEEETYEELRHCAEWEPWLEVVADPLPGQTHADRVRTHRRHHAVPGQSAGRA